MPSALFEIRDRFARAFVEAFGPEFADRDPILRPATDARFGDYQCNAAMSLAKELKAKPREVAEKIISVLDISDICEAPEIAGPGFINLRLSRGWLAGRLEGVLGDPRMGLERASRPARVVVDYSGPNIAKEMHVGHLRSMVIGDAIAAVLEFLGHEVIRQNHLGDWGTHIGMLLAHMFETFDRSTIESGGFRIADLDSFYRDAQGRYSSDADFAAKARATLVALQSGDESTLRAWEAWRGESIRHCEQIYERFGVRLSSEDIRAESDYRDDLAAVVDELLNARKLAVVDQGAVCIFLEGFKTKEGTPLPVLIRKSDGGYGYATTDLAAIRYRVQKLAAELVIYLTDARQTLHFQQIFAAVGKAGWDVVPETGERARLEHVTFGSVLGEDGRPLKTRSGENVKLKDLLEESIEHAQAVVDSKNPDLPSEKRRYIAEAVGVGAVKYADLSQNRNSDYIFSFEKMLALDGNTAPYMMYAYARIKSIERKGQVEAGDLPTDARIVLDEPAEENLAKKIIQFGEVVGDVDENLRPNLITSHLYELSQAFSVFYENCPVLKAATAERRVSRLWLCDLTARTLKIGLDLLGIRTLEQM